METKTVNSGKWYMTLIGGLIGLILGLILPCISIILFHQLYYVFLMFIPILSCLFIKLLRGNKNIFAILYALLLSLICTLIAGFMLAADSLIQMYSLPKYEIIRLTFLMIAEFGTYFPNVWLIIAGDIFDIIIMLAYITLGLLISWEFIFNPGKEKSKTTEEATEKTEEEFEYVYEDELEPDDEIVETEE